LTLARRGARGGAAGQSQSKGLLVQKYRVGPSLLPYAAAHVKTSKPIISATATC
jgi:hypothetical protein